MVSIPAGFAQVNYRFAGSALPTGAEVTCGLALGTFTGTPTDSANTARGAFVGSILTRLSNGISLTQTTVKWGPGDTGPTGISSVAAAGGLGTSGASPAVCYLVRKLTLDGGRAGRGKMFLPGVVEGDVGSDGAILPASAALMNTELDDFLAALIAGNLQAVLLHGPDSPYSTPSGIVDMVVDGFAGTQRRRQRR